MICVCLSYCLIFVAIAANVPLVPGTDFAITDYIDAKKFCENAGFPVIIKAAFDNMLSTKNPILVITPFDKPKIAKCEAQPYTKQVFS